MACCEVEKCHLMRLQTPNREVFCAPYLTCVQRMHQCGAGEGRTGAQIMQGSAGRVHSSKCTTFGGKDCWQPALRCVGVWGGARHFHDAGGGAPFTSYKPFTIYPPPSTPHPEP